MGRPSAHPGNRQGCPPGRWRRHRHLWRNHRARHRRFGEGSPKPGQDFFPLTVNYQEKTYAAGKIPGGYFKREGRPSENETLTSRLIDRPIRPLFPDGYKNDTQIIITVLQHDLENNPDILAMVAASAALTLSGVPFMGPIAGARVGYINGDYVLNPHVDEMPESALDLVVAGTSDAVLMVESEAKELAEDVMLGAVMFGHKSFQPVIDAIIKLAEAAAKEPRDFTAPDHSELVRRNARTCRAADLRAAYTNTDKQRYAAIDAGQGQGQGALRTGRRRRAPLRRPKSSANSSSRCRPRSSAAPSSRPRAASTAVISRPSARSSRGRLLPRTHGSALFTRGETQAIVVATLGTGEDEQYVDSLTGTYKATFMLHYNFPPYSVGETGRTGSPGRREIGHGKLAWRAIHPMMPSADSSPTPCAWSPRSPNPTVRPRWPPSAAPRWR
jgi:polyribonucleotide nucleotidyltransferase